MATYNGETWLDEQLQSIADQSWDSIDVWASDDGSSDSTKALLQKWQRYWRKGQFTVLNGESTGYADNFRSLIARADMDAHYYAFSDQDDIWLPDKLNAAVARLGEATGAALYGEQTILVDARGRERGRSPRFCKPPTFRNALVQNIAGGNTMVLNRSAFELLREASARTSFVSHDWFAYQIVSGAGGQVYYSLNPHVQYRQHSANLVGSNVGMAARAVRLWRALNGMFNEWNERNLASLRECRSLLTEDSLEAMNLFAAARSGPLLSRLRNLRKSGVYRQSIEGQISLRLACILGKM